MSTREIVVSATERLFNQKDAAVVDEFFGPVYVQHSALGPDGVDGLKGLVSRLPVTSSYTLVRVLADGDLVVTEGTFTGFAPVPLTGYDVWRVVDGRVVEHWDALGPVATHSATEMTSETPEVTAANKTLVSDWMRDVLIGRESGDATRLSADGVEYDHAVVYRSVHAVIAEGDLVYTRSEGEKGVPVIVNDVWRVVDGRISEHWGLVAPVPEELPHTNGAF